MHSYPWQPLPFRAKREASWAIDGYNHDWLIIPPGETGELANIEGPGIITHLWFAIDNDHEKWEGQWTMYRLHVLDPIPFTKSIRVTIEHGHNNHRSDDYSSTAYWYQKNSGAVSQLPSPENRLPRTLSE